MDTDEWMFVRTSLSHRRYVEFRDQSMGWCKFHYQDIDTKLQICMNEVMKLLACVIQAIYLQKVGVDLDWIFIGVIFRPEV